MVFSGVIQCTTHLAVRGSPNHKIPMRYICTGFWNNLSYANLWIKKNMVFGEIKYNFQGNKANKRAEFWSMIFSLCCMSSCEFNGIGNVLQQKTSRGTSMVTQVEMFAIP